MIFTAHQPYKNVEQKLKVLRSISFCFFELDIKQIQSFNVSSFNATINDKAM